MPDDADFGLASARRAADEDRLAEWVADFLSSPGSDNEALAAELAFAGRCWAGPVRLRLDQLQKLAGPDDGDGDGDGEDEWEDDVDEMAGSLEDGWEPPPLLVSCKVDGFYLEDGNHRHETLVRAGRTHAWALVAFDSDADRRRFLATYG